MGTKSFGGKESHLFPHPRVVSLFAHTVLYCSSIVLITVPYVRDALARGTQLVAHRAPADGSVSSHQHLVYPIKCEMFIRTVTS
jgi:hypothetical protein